MRRRTYYGIRPFSCGEWDLVADTWITDTARDYVEVRDDGNNTEPIYTGFAFPVHLPANCTIISAKLTLTIFAATTTNYVWPVIFKGWNAGAATTLETRPAWGVPPFGLVEIEPGIVTAGDKIEVEVGPILELFCALGSYNKYYASVFKLRAEMSDDSYHYYTFQTRWKTETIEGVPTLVPNFEGCPKLDVVLSSRKKLVSCTSYTPSQMAARIL